MASFPEIHPEKCPYCGKELALVTAKYEWDYYYKCEGCGEKYPTKNGQIPSMQKVRESVEYQYRTGTATPSIHTPPVVTTPEAAPVVVNAPKTAPVTEPAPAPVAAHADVGFIPYTVKTFCDTRYNGQFSSAGDQLQQYLNNNRIPRIRIISISSSMYRAINDILVLTLVHV